MVGIEKFWLFVVSGIILNILPGPDSLYIITRSASQGFRAGSAAALGIGAGTLVHFLAAAFGISAILATSATAYSIVKILGCLYLLYLGVTMIIGKASNAQAGDSGIAQTRQHESLSRVFYKGFLTNVLNPKVALFFIAFVPQFIAIDAPSIPLAFILLGLVFNFNGMIWCHGLAWFAAAISKQFNRNAVLTTWLTRAVGILFVYFGVSLALSEQAQLTSP